MLNICYYHDQIKDELDGAKFYIQKANALKEDHPNWASTYQKMAEGELEHAGNLVKIFEDDLKQQRTDDPIYEDIHNAILKMYSDGVATAKLIQI